MDYCNYDPVLALMNGVDPMATKYASVSPYNYSFNDPVTLNDPSGADPYTINYSATVNHYYTGYTYDDKIDYHGTAVYIDGQGWRNEVPGGNAFYGAAMGYGPSVSSMVSSWAPNFGGPVYLGSDANGNSIHGLPTDIAKAGGASSFYNSVYNHRLGMSAFNMVEQPLTWDEGYAASFQVLKGKLSIENAIFERWSIPVDSRSIIASAQTQGGPGDPLKDGYGPYRWDYGYQFDKATIMFFQWALGFGPKDRTFNNDRIAKAMKDAAGVNKARNYFYGEVNAGRKNITDGVTNFGASFGLKGLWQAGVDPIEQFVGSYNINIAIDGNMLTFTLTNTLAIAGVLHRQLS